MKRSKRTETTIEAHELWVVRRSGVTPPTWCDACAGKTRMLPPEEMAKLRGISTRTIYQWMEAGRLHFRESADGTVMICLASLPSGNE